jgi:hypothetical protein
VASPSPASKTGRPILSAAYASLALNIQEAYATISNEDICRRLESALRGGDTWHYLITYFGDDRAGDVIFSGSGELKRAPYTCSTAGATIDFDKAVKVVPLTTYEVESARLTEAGRRNSSRDLKQLQAIHDSSVGLGAACSMKESAHTEGTGLKLVESAEWNEQTLELIEAAGGGSEMEIKLIAPGKGSSAFYSKEVLQRDAGKFSKGTQIYINHATAVEESARPEGDWHKLAGALSTDAYWKESGKYGEGLYAKALFSSDYAGLIREKAPFTGMSIRANGDAVMEGKRPVLREGVPLLDRFTNVESVDVVTKAGAGGLILTEAARSANPTNEGGANEMDAAQFTKLQETVTAQSTALAAQTALNTRLLERAIRGDARELATKILKGTTLIEAAQTRVIEAVCAGEIPQADGVLDAVKLTEAVNAAAKREGEYVAALVGSGQVRGLGSPAPVVQIDAKEAERVKEERTQRFQESVRAFQNMGMPEAEAKRAAMRGFEGEVA